MRHTSFSAWRPCLRIPGALLGCALLAGGVQAQAPTAEQWLLHTGGFSHHFEPTRAPGRQWNEQHPGLGLERRRLGGQTWHWRQSAGFLQDSRNVWGGYAGVGLMREWRVLDSARIGAGLGAHAFYRSVSWSGRRAWVPALLPTLSLELPQDRLGVNLMWVPPTGLGGESRPALLFLQMTYRLQ